MAVASYLKRSSVRGNYSYRRRVPRKLKFLWGMSEVKVSFKTKSHAEALRRAAVYNTDFEYRKARLTNLLAGKPLTSEHFAEEAREILTSRGIHPQQIPSTKDEADKFFQKQEDYKDAYYDSVHTQHGYNPDGSIWTEYVEDPTNPYHEAYEILQGKPTRSIIPTVTEAAEMYLKVNAREKKRTPANEKKHEQRIWRAVSALGKSDMLITDFNRLRARRHKEALELSNPNWRPDTLNKTLGMLSAVFTLAIREYELPMVNPWARLKDEVTDRQDDRRSFTPDELNRYVHGLDNLNEEARLIGLLMVHTGCRTMEAAGLTLGDLQMQNNTPHLQLRPNHIRSLKNKQSKRDVPLIEKALDELKPYLAQRKSNDPKAPVFPRYGRDGGMDAVSQLLNGVIRKRLKIDDPTLVAYSTRHTMKDKMRAIRTTTELQHSILGHGKRTVADNYGEGELLRYLLDELVKADALMEWGN
jgi:integrase